MSDNSPKCRLCAAGLEKRICSLPSMPLTDKFVPIDKKPAEFIRDIDIYQCHLCGLVQNPLDFDHEGYYETYEYSSGHSEFTRNFMRSYASVVCEAFSRINGHPPRAVLEIGSGDGEQLKAFQQIGLAELLGVEPSEALTRQSENAGVPAYKGLFSFDMIRELPHRNFDICLSSYTLDHVRNPADYLRAASELLVPGGVLAFEVHDLSRIAERAEWCLFEHEHTIYMDADMARLMVRRNGFEVYAVNPLPETAVRANSLIVIAHKTEALSPESALPTFEYDGLQKRIETIVKKIDSWIDSIPQGNQLVGYGAGGRGVMTLAALGNASRFETLFDSNHSSGRYCAPKTHVEISGLDRLTAYCDAWCLVFSFGYFSEIKKTLQTAGFRSDRIVSLGDFLD
jgi:SAM-dependent methyltransferase